MHIIIIIIHAYNHRAVCGIVLPVGIVRCGLMNDSSRCRYIGGKVFVGHVASSISVYHKDECELLIIH